MNVTTAQTAARARALVDAEYKSIQPVKLSRNEIAGRIAARLVADHGVGAVLEVLDTNDWRDENVNVAERIAEGWNRLK